MALVDGLGGTAYVPFKSNSLPGEAGSLWEKMFHYYKLHREEFLAQARAMFARTPSLDDIVDRAYALLPAAVGTRLAAATQATEA